jgi:hypothetical protein
MKISKIACVALLGASFAVSSAFATPQSDYDTAVSNKTNAIKANKTSQKEKADAFNNVMTQVKVLQGIKELKDWNGAATNADPEKAKTFKKISEAVAAIKDELDKIKPASGSLEIKAADDTSKLTIDSTGAVKVNIDGNGGKQEATGDVTLDFANPAANAADIAKIFSDKNANVWNEFVKAFADEHAKLVKERDEKLADDIKNTLDPAIQTAAVALATAETATPTYEGTVKNYDALNDALKNDVAAKEKALAEKQADFTKKTDELNKAIAAAPEIKVKDDVATQKNDIDAAEALIAAANTDPLKKAFVEAAINAGVKVQKDGKELKSTDSEADLIAAFDTAKTNTEKAKENIAKIDAAKTAATAAEAAIAAPKAAVESAKNALTDFESKASDKTGVAELARTELASYKDNLDPKKAGSEAKKIADATKAKAEKEKDLAAAVKAFKEGANKDKVALKGTDADSIKAQLEAITKAETDIGAAGASEEKQKAAIKAAIEAGVPVANGTKKLSASDVAGLDAAGLAAALASATTNTTAAKNAVTTDLNTQVTAVKDQDTIIENSTKAIADQKAKVKEISNTRAKAIATSENLDKGESDVLTALSDVFDSNARVESIIVGESADDVAEGVSELHSTLDTATKSLNKGNFTDIVIFNTNLATNTRLAKLSNPYNGNLALAYAVKNMAGEKFADNGSDALSSVVKEYTNRYNYDNNLWGNVFGGKAKVKDAANTDVYGFTLGYDKAFDNTIVGGFFTLAKAQSDGNNVKNDADNYSFGVYTRSYFGQNELDSKFAYGFAKNTLKTKSSLIGDNEGKYDSKYFDIALDYGYVFDIGNAKFVKPIFGLEYTNLKNDSFTAGGPVELNFAKTSVKTLNAKLGAEFRAYTEKGDYFYVTPGIERELSKSADDSVLNFAGSRNVTFDADKKKYTYATLKTGAEFKITDSLSTNINFGVKARSKNQFYNGTLGLSYKF